MQLKPIRKTLTLATCSLLTATSQGIKAVETAEPWQVDSAVLYYSEADRVSLVEPVVNARKEISDDEFLEVRVVADTLTGASANGAIPTSSPQTFTSPSGRKSYTIDANETPLDPTFEDLRAAINLAWDKPITDDSRRILSAYTSLEMDYRSFGFGNTYTRDFNQRLTTLTYGFGMNLDQVIASGSTPVGLAPVSTTPVVFFGDEDEGDGDFEIKFVTDFIVGLTRVINRHTLTQLNYTLGIDNGYLTDPYKVISVVDATTGILASSPYRYEKRPDSRIRNALFWQTKHQFTDDVISVAYRYFWDDWGITSHTLDLNYRFEMNKNHFLRPHIRYYRQSSADFYYTFLTDNQNVSHASADYRLGDLTTKTVGIEYGLGLGEGQNLSLKLESMNQSGHPSDVIGVQQSQDLFPDVESIILQLNYFLYY